MSTDRINLAIGIGGFVIGILGIFISWWSIRTSWRIARDAGSLKRSLLSVRYGAIELKQGQPLRIVYALPKGDRLFLGTFRVVVENNGARVAEDTKLEIILPADANAGAEMSQFTLTKGSMPGLQRNCSRVGKLLHVYHHLPVLYASERGCIDEDFWCRPTVGIVLNPKVKTQSAKVVELEVGLDFAYVFNVVLFPKEEPPTSASVHLFCVEAEDLDELVKKWLPRERRPTQRLPLLSRLLPIPKKLSLGTLLVVPRFKDVPIDNGKTLSVESFSDSERWLLERVQTKWTLTPVEWTFEGDPE
jgi:hypothetical protein